MDITELEPYFTAISAGVSVAVLAFLVNVARLIRENANELLAIKQERMQGVLDDYSRFKEWSEREKAELKSNLEDKKAEVDMLLKQAGIDPSTLIAGKRLSEAAAGLQDTVHRLTADMQDTMRKLTRIEGEVSAKAETGAARTIAMVEMASGHYSYAASQYDTVAASNSATWEDHFSRGVAHANARQGRPSDLAALLAYSNAIALAPENISDNRRAKLLTYRAAMFKRLGRLPEAEGDLGIALKLATSKREKLDAHYNLACVYAMQKRSNEMYAHVGELDETYRSAVEIHLNDFFQHYKADSKLLAMLRLTSGKNV